MDDFFADLFIRNIYMSILGVDSAVAGISGDMFIAALSQLIDQFEDLAIKLQKILALKGYQVEITRNKQEFDNFRGISLQFKGNTTSIDTTDLVQTYNSIGDEIDLKTPYKAFGQDILEILIHAESRIHNDSTVHLHELGTIDTIIDTVLPAVILQELQIDQIVLSPVATGTGTIQTAHGILPVPAPATTFILEKSNLITVQGPSIEATTPTGAAILYALKKNFPVADQVVWKKHALGFGTAILTDRGNYLRVRLGELVTERTKVLQLETNLDDVTGEILGDAMSKLLEAGALDVLYYPIFTKKNRPGYTLRALTTASDADNVIQQIFDLTGTLGIRIQYIDRHVGSRNIKEISQFIEELQTNITFRVKVGTRSKVEFEDLANLSKQFKMSPLQLEEILRRYI